MFKLSYDVGPFGDKGNTIDITEVMLSILTSFLQSGLFLFCKCQYMFLTKSSILLVFSFPQKPFYTESQCNPESDEKQSTAWRMHYRKIVILFGQPKSQ